MYQLSKIDKIGNYLKIVKIVIITFKLHLGFYEDW